MRYFYEPTASDTESEASVVSFRHRQKAKGKERAVEPATPSNGPGRPRCASENILCCLRWQSLSQLLDQEYCQSTGSFGIVADTFDILRFQRFG